MIRSISSSEWAVDRKHCGPPNEHAVFQEVMEEEFQVVATTKRNCDRNGWP
jgi:hypothetical protein